MNSRLARFRPLIVAGVGGVFLALASPPTDFYPGVLVSYGLLALVLLSAAQSIIWGVGMVATHLLAKRLKAPLELAFAAGVFVALSLPTIFAWSPAGLLTPWPSLVQLGDVIGERGVSALIAVAAALLGRALLAAFGRRPGDSWPESLRFKDYGGATRPALASIALLVLMAAFGAARIYQVSSARARLPTIKIGLVDQAVLPLDRWNARKQPGILRKLRSLTESAERDGAELTIWPEAAYPYSLDHEGPQIDEGGRSIIGNGVHGPVLAGIITQTPPDFEGARDDYNSASVIASDGSIQPPADKLELLWFGETVPGSAWFPFLRKIFQKSGALIPGTAPRALTLAPSPAAGRPALTMAVLNCYEDTLSGVGRRVTKALSPNLLVNITNDAWFYDTAESELHARLGAMRAVEARHDLVRAVNLGVMTWVDATGTVRARWAESRAQTLIVTPAIDDGSATFFVRFGDWPTLFAMAGLAAWFWRRGRTREISRPSS